MMPAPQCVIEIAFTEIDCAHSSGLALTIGVSKRPLAAPSFQQTNKQTKTSGGLGDLL